MRGASTRRLLALLWLTFYDGRGAWKGLVWAALGRLHAKGGIADPVGRAKSLVLTDGYCAGPRRCSGSYSHGPTVASGPWRSQPRLGA